MRMTKEIFTLNSSYWLWFNLFVLVMLALDLGVFHRKDKVDSFKTAIGWSLFWIALAGAFNLFIYWTQGPDQAVDFLTGYLIEKSLSIDNIFVFVLIFSALHIPAKYQHKVLFWGIIGALVMRAIFIFAGISLISRFHWILYVFGAFLVFTGLKMVFAREKKLDAADNMAIRILRKMIRIHPKVEGHHFFFRENVQENGVTKSVLTATPLFVALVMVEITDVIFAVDSIPAVLAITEDPFIVYTSNVFAILGLRSLYFALQGFVDRFRYLKYGLAAVLIFIGIKMLIVDFYKFPNIASLGVIFTLITASLIPSFIRKSPKHG